MREIPRRLWSLVHRGRLDRELNEEIATHLAMQEEEFRRQGMNPAEAHQAALREFGGVAQTTETYRERRGIPWLESAAQDVRYGLRGLRRNPALAVAAVLSLALGIGANTAIFSLFHALMLRMLPVARPDQLVNLYRTGGWGKGYCSYPLYLEVAARSDLFHGVIARTGVERVRFTPRPGDHEQFAWREYVSGNYFQVLGIAPALGRLFTEDDNRVPGGHPLAVLSYDLWQNRYGGDSRILGATVLADDRPLTVIGVAAPGFHGVEVEHRADLWVPAMMADLPVRSANYWWVWIMARVRPDVTRTQVAAAVDVLMARHLAVLYPQRYDAAFRKRALGQRLEVRDAGVGISQLREEFSRPLQVLMIAVWLVLLAACANVANLLLARGAARRRETALRFSLGATRARLVRQSLTESSVLGLAGATVGIGLAIWGTRLILRFLPEGFGVLDTSPEPVVLAFTLGISALSVILFGLIPALRSTAINPAVGLRGAALLGGERPILRRCLVVAQVALSAVLVVLAGLFAHSLFELRTVDLGFESRNVISFSLGLPRSLQKDARAVTRQVVQRLETLPGIASVSYGFPGPFLMGTSSASIRVPGSEQTAQEPKDVETGQVAARYFETIGTRVVLGREFDRKDTEESRKVAVVNEAFVRQFFPGEKHPDARTLSFDDSKPEGGESTWIVGVVADIRHAGIRKEARPTVYTPIDQGGNNGSATIVVRTLVPATALLGSLDRELPKVGRAIVVSDFGTLRQHIDDSIFEQRLLAIIGGFFGALALLLAAVGLYGVIAYGTALRTAEIGVRIALGAQRRQVLWTILGDASVLVCAGLAIGLFAAMGAARAVRSLLFGIQPADPAAFVVTALVLAAAGLAATLPPARRATRLDPMRALRHE